VESIDVYLYGMTLLSHIHLLKGPYPEADTYQEIKSEVDKIVCLQVEKLFFAVGQWYEEFLHVTDDEVINTLNDMNKYFN